MQVRSGAGLVAERISGTTEASATRLDLSATVAIRARSASGGDSDAVSSTIRPAPTFDGVRHIRDDTARRVRRLVEEPLRLRHDPDASRTNGRKPA